MKEKYKMVKLPSKGECYPDKIKEVPVSFLTASDENIITSPLLNANGTMCDILLKDKIMDNSIDADKLSVIDRSAILLFLRINGYGKRYTYINGEGKLDEMDLSKVKFQNFKLKGDKDGYFTMKNGKDKIKFRLFTYSDEKEIKKKVNNLNEKVKEDEKMDISEYYREFAKIILLQQIISINGKKDNIDKWIDGLEFNELRKTVEKLQNLIQPVNSNGIELNEMLFNDINIG